MAKVILGMSGGVDSSVAALLLKKQGFEVEGLFMKNWEEDDGTDFCTANQDLDDAMKICDRININLSVANFSVEYWDNVFSTFLSEYAEGRTPNPDILCNKEIKFKVFLEYAQSLGADYIATGHYCRRCSENGHSSLLKGIDVDKDQSYFLYAVPESALSKAIFPLGSLTKREVRQIAEDNDFDNAKKKDSTGICFIGERRFSDFLSKYFPDKKGAIVTDEGKKVGEHQGLMYFTLGQRQGLGIGGLRNAGCGAWYTLEKIVETNTLIIGQGNHHPRLYSTYLRADNLHWINGIPPQSSFRCNAKSRYRQADQNCRIKLTGDESCVVIFDQPQRALTPGQSVVFYEGQRCMGGGIISEVCR
tara:strand:- start:8116 stop:9198 length:1083 start_codon:yes stop_codon:yes gene_type:complete